MTDANVSPIAFQSALTESPDSLEILPFSNSRLIAATATPASPTRLILDERALARLLETMIHRSGLTIGEVAEQMGIGKKRVERYLYGSATNPTLKWLLRIAGVCGAELTITFPQRSK